MTRLVTETYAGMCRGWPHQGHEDVERGKKQLTHALAERLIITRGMLTIDNCYVNPAEYLAASHCEIEEGVPGIMERQRFSLAEKPALLLELHIKQPFFFFSFFTFLYFLADI